MPYHVTERRDRPGTFQIIVTVEGYKRIRKTAQSRNKALANEEAAAIETRLLRERFHGPKPDERDRDRPFAEIAEEYLAFEPRHAVNRHRILACVLALGDVRASAVNDEAVRKLKVALLRDGANAKPATVRSTIITPIRSVLNFGAECNPPMCAVPRFKLPKIKNGKTDIFLPAEAEKLIAAAAPHMKALMVFLFGTGARIGEALSMDWQQLNLASGHATIGYKTQYERVAALPPAVVAALASLPHRAGVVFLWSTRLATTGEDGAAPQAKRRSGYRMRALHSGADAADALRPSGTSIKTAWHGALRRAGLTVVLADGHKRKLSPHATRHSWASWHYAMFHDLVSLRDEGGWQSVAMVERYQKPVAFGHEATIARLWGVAPALATAAAVRNAVNHYATKLTPDLPDTGTNG